MPNCLGALDGKHVTLRKPRNSGALYRNYKHTFSVVLMALVDAKYRFLYVDVGCNGRMSDGGVYNRSSLSLGLSTGALNVPPPSPLPGTTTPVPHFIVADGAFALRPEMMKPFPFRNLSKDQRIYNYRISRARRIVENAFGLLSQRFRVFLTNAPMSPEVATTVTLAACALHNFLRTRTTNVYIRAGDVDEEAPETHEIQEASWRSDMSHSAFNPMPTQIGAAAGQPLNAKAMRDHLVKYFNSPEGAVPWQENMI